MSSALFEEAKSLVVTGCDTEAQGKYSEFIIYCHNLLDGGVKQSESGKDMREMLALAYNNRGHLRYLCVDFDDAIDDYTKAVEYNENLAVAFYNRGQIYYRLGTCDRAVCDVVVA